MNGKKRAKDTIDVDRLIGQRLRALRIQSGMSQQELGKEVNISFQQVQKYEKGTNRISVSRMLQFCDLLQTTPHDVMGWKQRTVAVNGLNAALFETARDFSEFPEDLQIVIRKMCATLLPLIKKKK
jgi:transcriptional regulator with XRE-family HTH domain